MKDEPETLDLRGLKCPMPALLAKRHISARGVTLIRVLTDDPMAPVDIPHMCRGEGHEVVALERNGDETCIVLRARMRL